MSKDYYKEEVVKVVITFKLEYKEGAREDALMCALEEGTVDTRGCGPRGCYGAYIIGKPELLDGEW